MYPLSVTATDNDGTSTPENFTLTISAAQVAPIMGNIPNQTGTVGQAYNLNVASHVTLTDGDPILSYAIASGSLPAGLTLNTSTGLIS